MNLSVTRRRFVEITPVAGVALLAACSGKDQPAPAAAAPAAAQAAAPAHQAAAPAAPAEAGAMVAESDPQATALGYVPDASKVDKAKYLNYVAGSECSGCALYQGKAGDASGPCPLFGGKSVSSKGWCSSWSKKA
jgi:High potential iron-sulfur protein